MPEDQLNQYTQRSVKTMTPVEIVIKLYSEIERQLAIGVELLSDKQNRVKNYAKANDAFQKAEECIAALREALDMSIPISQNLDALYVYFYNEIVKANITKKCKKVKKIIPMIAELRDAFTQVSQMTKEEMDAQERANHRKKSLFDDT